MRVREALVGLDLTMLNSQLSQAKSGNKALI